MTDMLALWDRDTGNVVGEFASEDAAFQAVREMLEANGQDIASDLALVRIDANGMPAALASGNELALRALLRPTERARAQTLSLTGNLTVNQTQNTFWNQVITAAFTETAWVVARPPKGDGKPAEKPVEKAAGNRKSTLAKAA
jgi:hypothetical protein